MRIEMLLVELPVGGVGETTSVRPGRTRSRSKDKVEEKVKNDPDDKRKSPPSRKAPARGRYVDEYAQPPGV